MSQELLQQKIWLLLAVISVLSIFISVLFSIAVFSGKRILTKIDELIKAVQDLKLSDNNLSNKVLNLEEKHIEIQKEINEIKIKHKTCKTYNKVV